MSNNDKTVLTSPVAPEQGTDAIAFALKWPGEARLNLSTVFDTEAEAIDWLTRCAPGVVVVPLFASSPEAAPAAPLLMQDENSGRDGRRYNEWHASRPDARLNAREAAAAGSCVHGVSRYGICDLCDSPVSNFVNMATPSAVTDALRRLERAVDMHLGRSAWTQTTSLKGFGYSEQVREELFAAHDAARAALAQPAPVQAGAQQAVAAYLLTRPSGFSWVLMPFDITPYTRAIFEAEGTTITPLHAAPTQAGAGDAKGGA